MGWQAKWGAILDPLVVSKIKSQGAEGRGLDPQQLDNLIFGHFKAWPNESGAIDYLNMPKTRRMKLVLASVERLKAAAAIKVGAPEFVPYVLTNALEVLAEL